MLGTSKLLSFATWLTAILALPAQAVPEARNISRSLFESLEELARIVDISYCVGSSGIQKPFNCLSRCKEFVGFELVTVSPSVIPVRAAIDSNRLGTLDLFFPILAATSQSHMNHMLSELSSHSAGHTRSPTPSQTSRLLRLSMRRSPPTTRTMPCALRNTVPQNPTTIRKVSCLSLSSKPNEPPQSQNVRIVQYTLVS